MQKKIKSADDLKALRDQVRGEMELRRGDKDIRIVVHMGTCGIAAGARDVLAKVIDELSLNAIETVTVRTSGCLGLCDQEPMFTLTDRAGKEFCYGRLNHQKVREIIKQHVLANQPVAEYVVSA